MNEVSKSKSPEVLDARDQWCPIPAAWAKAALQRLDSGAVLQVLTTDPLAPVDLEVLCDRLGHKLIGHESQEGHCATTIEVGG
jgi:tRNA 2-thiouridine synthesizing protein A